MTGVLDDPEAVFTSDLDVTMIGLDVTHKAVTGPDAQRRLRDAGVTVWVTRIETVEESLDSMSRLLHETLGLADPPWLVEARALWSAPAAPRLRVAVPIWRDPWMVVGSQTYTDDLLARALTSLDAPMPWPVRGTGGRMAPLFAELATLEKGDPRRERLREILVEEHLPDMLGNCGVPALATRCRQGTRCGHSASWPSGRDERHEREHRDPAGESA